MLCNSEDFCEGIRRCPKDFQEAVNDLLITWRKKPNDMISVSKRKNFETASVVQRLQDVAVSDNPGDALLSGSQISGAIHGEMQQKAQLHLQQELKYKLANLIDIATHFSGRSNRRRICVQYR